MCSEKDLFRAIERRFGAGAIVLAETSEPAAIPCIPSGSAPLDAALGCGGWPRGRVSELFGPENAGKTTLALMAIAEAQRGGGAVALIDSDQRFDQAAARAAGVDLAHLLVGQPDSAEQGLEVVETLARSGAVALVVVDSTDGLTPQAEIDGTAAEPFAGRARMVATALRKLTAICYKTGCAILFVTERRNAVPDLSFGGNALKFYASVRVEVRRVAADDSARRVRVVKNKCAAPFRTAIVKIGAPPMPGPRCGVALGDGYGCANGTPCPVHGME